MFKERVYTNRVKVDYKTDFMRAQDYFKRHGVDIDFEFVESNYKKLSYKKFPYTYGNRIHLKPEAASMVPIDLSYDFTCFVFNGQEFKPPNIPNGRCYLPKSQPFIEISTHTLNPKDLTYVEICHEHMHALVMKARQAGFDMPDVMDSYYLNDQPENRLSNFGMQWKLLEPYLKSLKPTVTITRGEDNGWQTVGKLEASNFKCYTLERPWILNKKNVSCIPKGTYQCRYSFSPKFLKYTYEVLNVLSRSAIRIHSGNYFFDIEGCILLGDSYKDINNDGKVDILNSRNTMGKFEELMEKKEFTLIIK